MLTLLHPSSHPEIGDDTTMWIALHFAQLPLIAMTAWMFWILVAGLSGTAARIARVFVAPYLVACSVFDAVAGIGMGAWIADANSLGAADRAAFARLLDAFASRTPETHYGTTTCLVCRYGRTSAKCDLAELCREVPADNRKARRAASGR